MAAPLGTVPGYSVTIPAGGTGTIEVSGIALQPGAALPAGTLTVATQSLAAANVRTALFYGIDWGYTVSAPDQVALAVWFLQNSSWLDANHPAAQRIADAAGASAGTPSWLPDGRSLLTVVQSGQASIAPLSLIPSAGNASIGSGTLQITNTGINSVTLYLPYGTLFGNASGQVLVWASGTPAPGVTPTSQAIATATNVPATSTPAPGVTPTSQAIATATNVPATSTSVPALPTNTPSSRKSGGNTQATATATAVPQEASTTPTARPKGKATQVPATATASPSATATATGTDTPTDVPTTTATATVEVPTATATATATSVPPTATTAPTEELQAQEAQNPVLPSSQSPKPGSEKNNSGSTPNTTAASTPEDTTATTNVTSNEVQPNSVAGGASALPENRVAGPPLPVVTAAATQGATTDGPGPISTITSPSVATPTIAVPAGVSTIPAPVVPGAQTTFQVPISVPSGVPAVPTGVPTGAVPVETGTPSFTPTPPVSDVKPTPGPPSTPTPTVAPPPAATLPPVSTNDGSGVVDTTTDGSGAAQPTPTTAPAGGGPSTSDGSPPTTDGSPPTVNPVTGGGPSSLPLWLGAASILMVTGGWMLRRAGRKVAVAQAQAAEDKE